MFWKGRRGEKRLLELITVRNYFSCLPEPRKPHKRRQRREGASGPEQTSKSLPKKGHALSKRNLLSAATVSTIYHLNAHCIPWGQKQTRQLHFKAKNQQDTQALSLLSLYAFNSYLEDSQILERVRNKIFKHLRFHILRKIQETDSKHSDFFGWRVHSLRGKKIKRNQIADVTELFTRTIKGKKIQEHFGQW